MPAEAPGHAISVTPALFLQSETLLAELECWRELVARHLVEQYHAITEPELNHTALRTILQVLFVQIGEERGFVEHGTLQRLSGPDHIHDGLMSVAGDGGRGAPAGVFREDDSSRPPPTVDDETLRTIIGRTGSSEFPLPVSAIPLPHLAAVFERYLGSKMRIAEGYRVMRDAKSAVREAGGIHITPQPVVTYMVGETIGNLVKGKTPRDVSEIHILDPVCGPGTFLLAVYSYLLDWHLKWYRTHLVSVLASNEPITSAGIHVLASSLPVPDKQRGSEEPDLPVRYCGKGDPIHPDSWTLSLFERQRILLTSISGADIDRDAVEIARFLLLLATLDELTPPALDPTGISFLCMTAERLQDTIRCGNTLIGPDYFTHKQEHPFNAEERQRVNAFDWQVAYPHILMGGGFDAVIGAPPAQRPFPMKSREEYFQMHYDVYAKTAGLYGYFIEMGMELLKEGGLLSFIVPDMFLRAHHARPLRRFLLGYRIEEIADAGECEVLQTAKMRACILRIAKHGPGHAFLVSRVVRSGSFPADECTIAHRFAVDQQSLDDGGWTLEDRRVERLVEKIRAAGAPLEDCVMGQIERGTLQIKNNPFVVDGAARARCIRKDWRCKKFFRPLLRPADIRRYRPEKPDRFVISGKNIRDLKRCRAVWKYLQPVMSPAPEPAGNGPDQKVNCKEPLPKETLVRDLPPSPPLVLPVPIPKTPRIIYAPVQEHPVFSYDPKGSNVTSRMLWELPCRDPMLAAILNSKLGQFFITRTCPRTERGYQLNPEKLGKFPVFTPDFDKPVDTARHDRMGAHVSLMLELQKRFRDAKPGDEKIAVQREIEVTDARIDTLVYEIYGLTEEEIRIVEETTGT